MGRDQTTSGQRRTDLDGGPILMYDMIPGIGWVTPDHPLHSDHRRALATEDAHPTDRSESDAD